MKAAKLKNYYNILGITHNSNQSQIRSAYIKKVKTLHPDTIIDPYQKQIKHEEFVLVSEAYKILGDETKRYEYDLSQGFSTFDTQSDFDYNSDFSTNSKYSRIYPQTPFQQADMSYEKGRSYSGQDEMIARYKQMREHDMRNLKEQNDKVFKQMEEEFKQNYESAFRFRSKKKPNSGFIFFDGTMKTFPPHFFIVEVHQQPEWVDPRIFEFMSPDQKAFFQSKKLERESNRILFVVGSTFTNQTIGYIKKGVIPSDIRDDYSGTSSQEGRKNLEGVWDDYDYLEFYLTSGIFVGYAYKDSFLGEEQISIRRPDGKRIGIINAKLENRSSFWMPSAFRRRYLSRDIIDYSKPNNSVQSFSLKEYPTRFLYSKLDWKSDKDVKKETVCDVVSKWFLGTISSNSTSNVENSIHPAILVFMYSFDSLEKRKAKSLLYQKFSNIFYHLTNPFSKKKSRTTEKMED